MQVFIVCEDSKHEPGYPIAVFTTKEKADKCVETRNAQDAYLDCTIHEIELDRE